ncbi:MAG: 23S rRNA (adenine(2503)-C(2))-methyltransferase RlmN [Muribaculaceae bacterium]|nr:23S rRNA (adenine(2503)-C(2))-methyltransferase RlmN [Muribaculaceae bacterium]
MTDKRIPLVGMTLDGLREVCEHVGAKPFAAKQMAHWLYQKRVSEISQMTDLSLAVRERLGRDYKVGLESPVSSVTSMDGTVKYLFTGVGNRDVEAVYIPDKDRATLCVSSQAGCRMNCAFCMTGRLGYQGQLTAHQIMNQVLSVENSEKLTNLVFMGMGEPADNAQAVLDVIEILTAPWGLEWSPKRITVSSVGKPEGLKRFLNETRVHIALSVHSPFSEERAGIMPVEKAWPVEEVMHTLRGYDFAHQRRLSVEYIMWRGVNDDERHAQALARLLKGSDARVNLIRYHAIDRSESLQPSTQQTMERFRDFLNSKGVTATIRASRGEDIMAACGMLAGKKSKTE